METTTQIPEQVLEETASPGSTAKFIREIKHETRKRFSSEEKSALSLKDSARKSPSQTSAGAHAQTLHR